MPIEPIVKDWDANPETGNVDPDSEDYQPEGDGSDEDGYDYQQQEEAPAKRSPSRQDAEARAHREEVAGLKAQIAELAEWKRGLSQQALKNELANTKAARRQALENQDYDSADAYETSLEELKAEQAKYATPAPSTADNQYTRYMNTNSAEVDVHVGRVLKAAGGIEGMSKGRQSALKTVLIETVKECVPQGYTPQEIAQEFAERIGVPYKNVRASKVAPGRQAAPSGQSNADMDIAFQRLHPDAKALWDAFQSAYKGDKKKFINDYKNFGKE